jgi:chromosome segregation ATPase
VTINKKFCLFSILITTSLLLQSCGVRRQVFYHSISEMNMKINSLSTRTNNIDQNIKRTKSIIEEMKSKLIELDQRLKQKSDERATEINSFSQLWQRFKELEERVAELRGIIAHVLTQNKSNIVIDESSDADQIKSVGSKN